MKKHLLERFAKKYYLNGLIESAVWVKENETLQVCAVTPNKKMFVGVKLKDFHAIDDTKFGVLVTDRLLALLKTIPLEDVSFNILKSDSGEVKALMFSAEKSKVHFATTKLALMDAIPKLNYIPPWSTSIVLDKGFKLWLLGAYTVFRNEDTVFTVAMSKETEKLEIIVRHYSDPECDCLYFQPSTVDNMNIVKAPISFNARFLKAILAAC